MLSKINRANSAEITLVKEKGKLIPSRLFGLLVYDLKNSQPSRFAFIVSTKVHKRAVKRNQAKRNLRFAVQTNLAQIEKGKIVLFLARKTILNQNSQAVKEEVQRVFRKTHLLS